MASEIGSRPLATVFWGVTPRGSASYNNLAMLTVIDAAQQIQFAFAQLTPARVLAALPGVPASLSGKPALAPASRPLR